MSQALYGCDQCEEIMIQGVRCHEAGCCNAWIDTAVNCFECGCRFFRTESRFQKICDSCSNPIECEEEN